MIGDSLTDVHLIRKQSLGILVGDKLYASHHMMTADVTDDWQVEQSLQLFQEIWPYLLYMFQNILTFDNFNVLQCSNARDGVTAVGETVCKTVLLAFFAKHFINSIREQHCAQWQIARRQPLGAGNNVWLNAEYIL